MPSSEDSVSVHKYVCKSWTNSLESCWINGIWIQTYTLIQAEQVFILFYSFINSSTIMFDTCVCACSQNTEICFQWLCAHFFCVVCVYVLVIDCMCVFLRLLLEARKEKRAILLSWSLWVNSTVLPDRVFWEGGGCFTRSYRELHWQPSPYYPALHSNPRNTLTNYFVRSCLLQSVWTSLIL